MALRVLQVCGGLDRGGLESFIMNVYRSIDRSQIQFDFLLSKKGGALESEAISMGANIYYVPARNKGFKSYNQNLDEFFLSHASEFAAVHINASTLSLLEPLKYATKYGIKTRILHSHSSSISGSKLHYFLHLWNKHNVKKWANYYFGCSDLALKWFYQGTGVYDKSRLIANGVDSSLYIYNPLDSSEIRKEFNIPEDAVVIGHVGRIMWIKNHAFLVDVFNEYSKINPNSYLMIVGEGPLKEEVENKVSNLGISQNVIFTGSRGDVNRLLQAFDIFVMPSHYEGLPMVLVEAQSAGLPVLCSDTISMDSKLTDSYYTLKLDAGTTAWCETISKILSSHKRTNAQDMIINAGFDIKSTTKILTKIYCR